MKYIVYSDGGSRGNPGPAGFGFVIYKDGNKTPLFKGKQFIGEATNNQAEYKGIIAGLNKLFELDNNPEDILVNLDSKLIVEQVNGNYKVKSENVKPLYWELREIITRLGIAIKFKHVARELNKEADKLANEAMDEAK